MIKIDLHSHSIISHDGGITAAEYEKILSSGALDCIAITDHNETSFARIMQKKLGDKIIIGEEITTTAGEIIGLFLSDTIPAGLHPLEAAKLVHAQGGIVYIPHPFEVFRKGLQKDTLETIIHEIDIVEVFNGRGRLRGKPHEAQTFAQANTFAVAASSDAHGYKGLGKTYSIVTEVPTGKNIKSLLEKPVLSKVHAPIFTLFYPFINRIKNKIILTHG